MLELHFFENDSLVFLDTSSLLEAGSSSNTVNHFLDDLRQMKNNSNSTIIVSESVIKELEELNNSDDVAVRKSCARILDSLLSYVKAGEIRLVKNHFEDKARNLNEAMSLFFEDQVASLANDRRAYVITNDDVKAFKIYALFKEKKVNICRVEEDDGNCQLTYMERGATEDLEAPVPKPDTLTPTPTPTPSPVPQGENDDIEKRKRKEKQKRIDAVIQIDKNAADTDSPEIVKDTSGNIKVPHL